MLHLDTSALTVGKPARWLMALPTGAANAVCATAYLAAAGLLHMVFALQNGLLVAGNAASGIALAGALLCGRKVLPGLWTARFLWEIALDNESLTSTDYGLAALAASALLIQTETARQALLALRVLPSKLRRLRKSLQICGIGLLAASFGTGLYLLGMALLQRSSAVVPHWGLQAAGLLLPEWAGIAILLPLTVLWMQDDAWRETRKWRITLLVALGGTLTLGMMARAVWTDEQRTLTRFHDSNAALAQRLNADFQGAQQAVQILQSHIGTRLDDSSAEFGLVATAIQASQPHLQALSWNPLIPHSQRSQFESRLRAEYGSTAALLDRAPDGQLVASQAADFYVAVEHIAPLQKNRAALGLNIHANPTRRAAIDHAMATGNPAITSRIQLVQETGSSWGALYLSPIFSKGTNVRSGAARAPTGFAVAVLRMEDIVGSAVNKLHFSNFHLTSGEPLRQRVVHYRFVDLQEPAATQTLFEDGHGIRPPTGNWLERYSLLALQVPPSVSQPITFADRRYALQSTPSGDFWTDELSRTPFFALLTGVLLTWMALAAGLQLTGSTQLLTIAVEKRTHQLQLADAALQASNLQLRQQSVQLRSVLSAMNQGYLGFDADGVLVLANDKSFELIAMPAGDARQNYLDIARHLGTHFTLAQAQALSLTQSMLSVRNDGDHHVYRNLIPTHAQAQMRFLDMRVYTMEDAALHTIILLHDTTPEMQLDRSKSQFMAFAAHEIRTPLTVILGYADLLLTRPFSQDRTQQMAEQILRKSQGLNQLLERMLDLSDLDLNGLDAKRIRLTDLGALCALAARDIPLPQGRERPVMVHNDPIPWCRVDPVTIHIAVTELLNNAYAFSPAGTPVTVSVGPILDDIERPGGVRIRISDQGQGMTDEVRSHIFERFYRADGSGKHPGFGLGLSTAKLIADLHKAYLHIESTPQQGTVVEMNIPQGNI